MYDCDQKVIHQFSQGVFKRAPSECSDTEITHTALVVGYGTTQDGEDYWELLNSYSESWGDQGLMKLARNTDWDQKGGQNGILTKPAYRVPRGTEEKHPLIYRIRCMAIVAYLKNACMSSKTVMELDSEWIKNVDDHDFVN